MTRDARRRPTPHASAVPRPMLATTSDGLPDGDRAWVYEPKYDGIRVIAAATGAQVTLRTRSDRETAAAFPEIAAALARLAEVHGALGAPRGAGRLVLDGELVALEGDAPARFGALQPRLFVTSPLEAAHRARTTPAAFVAFDCLELDGRALIDRPWHERRRALETLLAEWKGASGVADAMRGRVRISTVADDGRALLTGAATRGEEGIVAKDPTARYHVGRRSDVWRKVKLETSEDFVVLGVTPQTSFARTGRSALPNVSRAPRTLGGLPPRLGALVVGEMRPDGRAIVAGRVGAGLAHVAAAELARRLGPLVRAAPPVGVADDDPAVTWVAPHVVVTVRFLERTASGALRQPVLVGLRPDLTARDLVRRATPTVEATMPLPRPPRPRVRSIEHVTSRSATPRGRLPTLPGVPAAVRRAVATTVAAIDAAAPDATRTTIAVDDVAAHAPELLGTGLPARAPLVDACGWSWTVAPALPLAVTHTGRALADGCTKRDLLRYYASVSPYLLRALAGRPLVLRRHTDVEGGTAFYQQHAAASVPAGVDTAIVANDAKSRFVGGTLVTLLYLAQLGAVSMDPWHGRADAPELVDYAIVDLDPGPEAPFARVVDVARWVHDALIALGLASVPKTSGASGMHVVVPLPSDTPAEAARLLAELVATQVAGRHPEAATILRTVRRRAADAVYVDFLQNVAGKTVASVYAARATPTLTVSTPLRWEEVTPALDPRDWTIRSVPARLAEVGDVWGEAMLRGNDLEALRRALFPRVGGPTPPRAGPR